jgi:hypothetical protein
VVDGKLRSAKILRAMLRVAAPNAAFQRSDLGNRLRTFTTRSRRNRVHRTASALPSLRHVELFGYCRARVRETAAMQNDLKIDPPRPVAPTVSIKHPSLSVPAHGKIDLGLSVTAPTHL